MRVLVINHPESDYGAAFIYNGLCQNLGAENVFDFPLKRSYHGETHFYTTPAIRFGETAPFPWMPQHPYAWETPENVNLEYVREKLREGFFDLVLVESCRVLAKENFYAVQGSIPVGVPVVVHDGEDYREMDATFITRVTPMIMLKREMLATAKLIQSVGETVVMAFPFSTPYAMEEETAEQYAARPYDVSLLFGNTHASRRELISAFRAEYKGGEVFSAFDDVKFCGQGLVGWNEFMSIVRKTKLGVSARGFGVDTCRYWEIAGNSLLFADHVDLAIPFAFTPNFDCLTYWNANDAVDMARWAKSHPELVYEMYQRCIRRTNQCHTNKARVKYLLDHVEEIKNARTA